MGRMGSLSSNRFFPGYQYAEFSSIVRAAISAWLTASHPNSDVKQVRAGVVLRWGTTREGPVLLFLFLLLVNDLPLFFFSSSLPSVFLSSPLYSSFLLLCFSASLLLCFSYKKPYTGLKPCAVLCNKAVLYVWRLRSAGCWLPGLADSRRSPFKEYTVL